MFLSYLSNNKAYRVFNERNKLIIESINVLFCDVEVAADVSEEVDSEDCIVPTPSQNVGTSNQNTDIAAETSKLLSSSSSTVTVLCDNTNAINIFKSSMQHSHTQYIDIRHNFICEFAESKVLT